MENKIINFIKIITITFSFVFIIFFCFIFFGCVVNAQTIEYNYTGGDQILLNGTRYWFSNAEQWRGVFTGNNNNGNPTTDFRLYYPEFEQQYFEIKINIERGFFGLLGESLDRQIADGQIGLHDSDYWGFPISVYLNNNQFTNVEVYQFCDGRYIPTLNVYCNITIRGEYRGTKGLAVNLHNNYAIADVGVGGGFNFFIRSSVLATPDPSLTTEVFVQEMNQLNQNINNMNNSINNINNSINDMNNTITDSNVDDQSSFFSNFQENNHGLSSIITAPLNLITSISSNTCTPIDMQIPFVGSNFSLPCMSTIYKSKFATALGIYQTITFGLASYYVIVKLFAYVKSFQNPQDDRIEVVNL